MQDFRMSPAAMVGSIWGHRALIRGLAQREVVGRYRGSALGMLWSFFQPLFMLAVYTFVFSVVFKARWGSGGDSKVEFALVLFVGMLLYNLFAECIARAPGLILANANYVKKVVFPLEILPVVNLAAALFHAVVGFGVWLVFDVLFLGAPHWTVLVLPLVLIPLALWTLGLSWLLASLGVYLRDVGQVVGVLITVVMFLTPIFYPLSAIPERYRTLVQINPLAVMVEQARQLLMWGRLDQPLALIGQWLAGLLICWLGFAWFQKTRKGFADVL